MTRSLFPKRKRSFLLKWQLIGCSFSVVPWFHCPGDILFGCLEWHLFSPKEILSCVFVWGSDWESTWPWRATQVMRSIMIEKIGFSRVWSCSPSERCSPRGGHGTDIMPISYFFCEKRGVWWAICGTFSPSNLESSMMDTMSSSSGGMSKLMEWRIHQMGAPLGWTLLYPSVDS